MLMMFRLNVFYLPTLKHIFDFIDPTTFVSADSSQGNEAIFGVNAGKQCVAMSLTAIIYHQIQDNSTLNNILVIGNNLYSSVRCSE